MKKQFRYLSFLLVFFITSEVAHGQGSISGPSSLCMSYSPSTATYRATGFNGATSYQWILPSYATIISGTNTATVSVRFSSPSSGGTIVVYALKGSTTIGGAGLHVALNYPAGAAGAITGPSTVCAGQTNVEFSVGSISRATQYSWTAPAGATIVSQSGRTVKLNFSTSFTGGSIRVQGIGGACGAGTGSTKTISRAASPGSPGTIVGKSFVSRGENNVAYSISPISNTTGYEWTVPSGVSIISGQNTRSIQVKFQNEFVQGNITVKGKNSGCTGPSSPPLRVKLSTTPGTPTFISVSVPCLGSPDPLVTYKVKPVENEDPNGYRWSYGPGIIPMGNPDQGGNPNTSTMQVKFRADMIENSTWISVYNINSSGSGGAATQNIPIFRPPSNPGAISGPSEVCPGQKVVAYSVPLIQNATSYVWSLPDGVINVSQMNNNVITVDFSSSFAGGDIKVYGMNGPCGAGPVATLNVNVPASPRAPDAIIGEALICKGREKMTYSISLVEGSVEYEWSVSPGIIISSGQGTSHLEVKFLSSFNGGNISVKARNECYPGPSTSLSLSVGEAAPVLWSIADGNWTDNIWSTTKNGPPYEGCFPEGSCKVFIIGNNVILTNNISSGPVEVIVEDSEASLTVDGAELSVYGEVSLKKTTEGYPGNVKVINGGKIRPVEILK